jgi:hypothetical protein
MAEAAELVRRGLEELGAAAEEGSKLFADTFAGQLSRLQQTFALTDATTEQQLQQLTEFFEGQFGAPAIAEALRSGSLGTDEGRQAISDALLELFNRAAEGTVTEAERGALSLEEFAQALLDLEQALDSVTGAVQEATFALEAQRLRELLQLTDAPILDQLAQFREFFATRSPAIAQALNAGDFATPEGRRAISEALVQLFRLASQDALDATSRGTLSTDEFIASLLELEAMLDQLDPAATEAAAALQQLSAALSDLQLEFELFEIDDPIRQFQRLRAVIGNLSPALASALQGIDLSTEAGRESLRTALQNLFLDATDGTPLTAEQLGSLTDADLRQALSELAAVLRAAEEEAAAETEQTEGYGVRREITEVTGSRMIGVLTSIDVRIQEAVEYLATLAGGRRTPVVAPSTATLTAATSPTTGGGGISIGSVTLEVIAPAGTTEQQATAIAQQGSTKLFAEIDRLGGLSATRQRVAYGDVRIQT